MDKVAIAMYFFSWLQEELHCRTALADDDVCWCRCWGGINSLDLLEAEADEVDVEHCPGVVANVLPLNNVLPPNK